MNTSSKKDIFVILIIVIFIAYLLPLLHVGVPKTHDAELHIARFAAYYKAFIDGQIPPRWASDLNFGYGTPLFIFFYPLPGYLGSVLHAFFGLNFQNSYKLLTAISFIVASIFFYLWMRELFRKPVAFVASLLYGLAPYHLLDVYVRGAISDLLAFVFIPIVFLNIEKIYKNPKNKYVFMGGVSYALLILSQNALALIFSPVIFCYAGLKIYKKAEIAKHLLFMILEGLLFSAFFWLPAIVEQKFTHSILFLGKKYITNFPTILHLIYSTWGFGPEINKPGGLSAQVGPINILFAILSSVLIFKFKKFRKDIIFWAVFLTLAIFMSLNISAIFWRHFTILQKLEFPWRFTALSSFACAILGAYLISIIKNRFFIYCLIGSILILAYPMTKAISYELKPDLYYLNYPSSTDFGAVTTIWSASEPTIYPPKKIEIISGQAQIINFKHNSTNHFFKIVSTSGTTILDNTIYFPGWRATVDQKLTPIEFQDTNHRGLITFKIPSGLHTVEVSFHDSPIRLIGNIISLASLINIFGFYLFFTK